MDFDPKDFNKDRILPIGVQDFEDLRLRKCLYVDKTAYAYKLIHTGKPYFLSRPRRFGKSLFLSTLRAYWEGRKDLFTGLAIEKLEEENEDAWQPYPVFYFDFNKDAYQNMDALELVLDNILKKYERVYEITEIDSTLPLRFEHLIEKAVQTTGKNVVVLVDEYDKPLLEKMADSELLEHNRTVFKGFFSILKSADRYIRFVFITGVTKFSKVSIFSDLNNLRDISMTSDYSEICGITDNELKSIFMPEIEDLASSQGESVEECIESLRKMYDGYCFSEDTAKVYNPFSLLNAFASRKYNAYWFESGTPTFLINKLKETGYDIKKITDQQIYATETQLMDYRVDNPDIIPLFYQSGYLTIKGYNKAFRSYQLGYPNDEVKYGLLESLAPYYLNLGKEDGPLSINSFGMDIYNGDTDSLFDRFKAIFARLPYTTDEKPVEQNFQNVIYIIFMLLNQFVQVEVHSALGRSDCIVETDRYIYIFEFKRDKSADDALQQIEEQKYAAPYAADKREIIKVGANFDSKNREMNEWKVVR